MEKNKNFFKVFPLKKFLLLCSQMLDFNVGVDGFEPPTLCL